MKKMRNPKLKKSVCLIISSLLILLTTLIFRSIILIGEPSVPQIDNNAIAFYSLFFEAFDTPMYSERISILDEVLKTATDEDLISLANYERQQTQLYVDAGSHTDHGSNSWKEAFRGAISSITDPKFAIDSFMQIADRLINDYEEIIERILKRYTPVFEAYEKKDNYRLVVNYIFLCMLILLIILNALYMYFPYNLPKKDMVSLYREKIVLKIIDFKEKLGRLKNRKSFTK